MLFGSLNEIACGKSIE